MFLVPAGSLIPVEEYALPLESIDRTKTEGGIGFRVKCSGSIRTMPLVVRNQSCPFDVSITVGTGLT